MIYKFYSNNCQPCKLLSKTLENINYSNFVHVNIDEDMVTPAKYRIRGVPTMVYVVEGIEYGRLVGAKNEREINEWLLDCMEQANEAE